MWLRLVAETGHKVALADHADEVAVLVDDGKGTDSMIEQDLGDALYRRIGRHGNDAGRHQVACGHRFAPLPFRPWYDGRCGRLISRPLAP